MLDLDTYPLHLAGRRDWPLLITDCREMLADRCRYELAQLA